ncbi:HalOD1 output domain-containing protein [Halobaculum sp. EA56]|uniref:HalOD1 output domain-containing protein n=1 Tax=Halobaculum sp. EA56 TaxID=3421648 RepID=UPI003EBF6838
MPAKQVRERTTVVRTADDDICQAVIAAVADAWDVRPMELDTPLFEAIDPEALQRIFPCDGRSSAADTSLEFSWAGCTVTVRGPGRVVVTRNGDR